jgi:transcriptional regulator with XRE-family HTH domain
MRFGERIRELRKAKGLSLRELAELVDVSHTYLSKVENQKLDFGEYPSESLIHKLAAELEANENQLLLLAEKIPSNIKQMILRSPQLFHDLAKMKPKEFRAVERFISEKHQ